MSVETTKNYETQDSALRFSENMRAHNLYREFIPKNSFFFRYQALILIVFGIFTTLGLFLFFGIKWLWVGVVYVICHGVASVRIRHNLDAKFAREHPLENYLHFRKEL